MQRVSKQAKEKAKPKKVTLIDTPLEELESLSDTKLNRLIEEIEELDEDEFEDYEEKMERATIILKERATQAKQALDDGTVRGLILSGDYSDIDNYVIVRNPTSKNKVWERRTTLEIPGKGAWKKDEKPKGSQWVVLQDDDPRIRELVKAIILSCKRMLKEDEIVLCSFGNLQTSTGFSGAYYKPLEGIIYTNEKMFILNEGQLDYIIEYSEIENIDVENEYIRFDVADGEDMEIDCLDNDWAGAVYNLLSDIKERIEG